MQPNDCVKVRRNMYLNTWYNNIMSNIFSCVWLLIISLLLLNVWSFCRSQWPRGLRRGSTAACLLGLWVRIPPGLWMSVSCECCALSGTGLCTGWSLVQRSPTDYHVSERNREASIMRRPWPTRGCCAVGKTNELFIYGDIHYITNSFVKMCRKYRHTSLGCELRFFYKFFLLVYCQHKFCSKWCVEKYTGQVILLIIRLIIHSSFRVLNFTLPACRPKFARVFLAT